jgi:hypothetical protein
MEPAMTNVEKALATQLANMETRTGKSLAELSAIVQGSGLTKHGEVVKMLKATLGMGHGDATTLVHHVRSGGPPTTIPSDSTADGAVLDGLYVGPKAALRPIHDAILAGLQGFGPFEAAPKKTYVSYRRSRQFCMVGPATNSRVEVGLNMKGVAGTDRLEALPAGQMCQYKVRLTDPAQVDAELLGWIRQAYEAAE